jgi:hypothetical protein
MHCGIVGLFRNGTRPADGVLFRFNNWTLSSSVLVTFHRIYYTEPGWKIKWCYLLEIASSLPLTLGHPSQTTPQLCIVFYASIRPNRDNCVSHDIDCTRRRTQMCRMPMK